MALSFPLTQFFAGLPVTSAVFDLSEAMESTRTQGGEILTSDMGPRLWAGTATLPKMYHRQAEQNKALLNSLRQTGRSFMAFNPAIPGPAGDPDGAFLASSSPTIATLNANNRELTIGGLPNGFGLMVGDMLSFSYSAAPTRYALHQIMVGSTADALGITGSIEVTPNIRAGAATSAAVSLWRPACKAVLVPGSVTVGAAHDLFTEGLSFKFIQTLR